MNRRLDAVSPSTSRPCCGRNSESHSSARRVGSFRLCGGSSCGRRHSETRCQRSRRLAGTPGFWSGASRRRDEDTDSCDGKRRQGASSHDVPLSPLLAATQAWWGPLRPLPAAAVAARRQRPASGSGYQIVGHPPDPPPDAGLSTPRGAITPTCPLCTPFIARGGRTRDAG